MVIQRLQSLYLFIAMVLMAVFVVLFILLTIVKFKNLKLQKRMAWLSILLVLSFAVSFGLYASFVVSAIDANAVSCDIKFVALLPLLAVILMAMAIGRIKADMKLLSDSDRLR